MVRKIISTFFSKFTSAGISFLLLLITARFLGTEIRGEISLFVLGLAIIQTINEIVCGPALVYIIPQSDIRSITKLVYVWVFMATGITVGVLYLFGLLNTNWLPHISLLALLMAFTSFHQQALLAGEKITAYNILSLIPPLLLITSICFFIFYLQKKSFNSYLYCVYISQIPAFLIGVFYLKNLWKLPGKEYSASHAKILLKNGLFNQVANIAHLFSNRINYYLLGAFAVVGVYSTGVSVIESVWIISQSVAVILLSRIVNSNDKQQSQQTSLQLARVCSLLSFMGILVLCCLPLRFYEWVLGQQYSEIKPVLVLLGPGILCISFSTILCNYFAGTGKNFIITLANFSGFIITFIAAIFLIPGYGMKGAAVATSISYFCSSLFLLIVFKNETGLKLKEFIPGTRDLIFMQQQLKNLLKK